MCSECGPLCIDCDRVLHLSRKFRSHQRQVGLQLIRAVSFRVKVVAYKLKIASNICASIAKMNILIFIRKNIKSSSNQKINITGLQRGGRSDQSGRSRRLRTRQTILDFGFVGCAQSQVVG